MSYLIFIKRLEDTDMAQQKKLQAMSQQQIEDLFSALMQKAFRGELEAEGTHSTVKNI